MTDSTPSPLELLRKFHSHADKFENNVSTDEYYWADNGEVIMRARRWYWQSDLRKQTVAALGDGEDVSTEKTK